MSHLTSWNSLEELPNKDGEHEDVEKKDKDGGGDEETIARRPKTLQKLPAGEK